MKLKINGKLMEFPDNINLIEILEKEDVIEPVGVEVFVNKVKINFKDLENFQPKDGDEIEYLYLFASG